MRFAGVLFLFPIVYYFSHPEPYHMRPLDPLLIVLGTYAIQTLRAERREAVALEEQPELELAPVA
jgi:hypothetical protein